MSVVYASSHSFWGIIIIISSIIIGSCNFRITSVSLLLLTVFLLWGTKFQHAIWIVIIIVNIITIIATHTRYSYIPSVLLLQVLLLLISLLLSFLLMRNCAVHLPCCYQNCYFVTMIVGYASSHSIWVVIIIMSVIVMGCGFSHCICNIVFINSVVIMGYGVSACGLGCQ